MSKPKSNGIVELVDDGQDMDAVGWHCSALDSCDVWLEATQSILPAAIKWYCDYLTWEDSQIAEEDRISLS